MADEVTKKDLQSLQGYVNKKMAEMEKKLQAKIEGDDKSLRDSLNKTIETLNKNDAELLRGHTDQTTALRELRSRLDSLTALVNQHAAAIKELS